MNPNFTLKQGHPYKPIQAHGTVIFRILFFLFLLLAIRESAQAQKTWTGTSGNWSDASKWSGGTVPTSTDNVNLNTSGSRTITLDVDVTINNLSIGNNSTLSFNASRQLTINGTYSQTNGTVNLNTGTMTAKGNWSKSGGTFNTGTGTMQFNGTSGQTITEGSGSTFYNVTISNGNNISLASNLTVSNTLLFTTGKLILSGWTLTLNGTVSGMTASNSIRGSSTSNISIGGTGALGNLFLDATTPGTTNLLAQCTINRTSSGTVVLGSDVYIGNTLTLTNGILQTGSNKMVMNAGTTLNRTNGYVNGNLQKNVATGATSRTFEIGDANYYTPVSMSFGNVTTAGDLMMSTSTPLSSHPAIGSIALSSTSAVNRYWTSTSVNTLAFTNYSATLNFNAADVIGGASTSSLKAGIYNSSWVYPTMGTLNATNSTFSGATTLGSMALSTCTAPTAFSVTGGGAYCSGGTGSAIGLSGSQTGVTYQLLLNGSNTGSPIAGTGSAFSFGNQTAAGTYTVTATRTSTGCTSTMTGSVDVTINPLPGLTVTGTTTVCSGASTVSLTYSSAVNSPDQYAVQWGSAALAAGFTNQSFTALSGGTLSIDNLQSAAGTYAVDILIRNSSTGCQSTITSGTVCSVVAENATLSMSSPNGAVFTAVNFASYGTPTGSCGSFATSTCHATTSSSVVSALAVGRSSFSVTANNATFGDPCVGTVKQLAVQATYGFTVTISAPLTATITGSSTVCEGSSTTLTASAATTYAWSTGETTQSIVVSPTTTTTYTVNTSNGGCNSVGSKTVSILLAPTVTLSTTSPSVCSGTTTSTITYSNPQNGPDRYSITWTPAAVAAGLNNVTNATLSGGSFNIINIPSTAGTYPALITITNSSNGCSSYYGGATLCATAAENATLSMTAPSGNRFVSVSFASYGTPTGSCGGYATSSCHSATSVTVVQNAALGQNTFSIGATNGNFGDPCSGTIKRLYVSAIYSPFALTVNAIPGNSNASSNSPICTGNTINLTATTVSGVAYSWTGPGGFTSSAQNPSFTATSTAQSGVYSVRTLLNGCYSTGIGSVSVTVNQAPSATIAYGSSTYCTSVTSPQSVILTGTTGGAFTGTSGLSLNGGSGAITPSTSTVGGPYTVTYTIPANGGCAALNATTTVSIAGLPTAVTVSGGGTFCNSATITASGGTGGTIYFQGTTSNGTSMATASSSQVVTSSGTYYFRARNASGCWGNQGSVTVTIRPTPTLSGAALNAPYCSGSGATINLNGLVASSVNTVNYSINGVAQTPISSVTANGSGTASFTSAALTAANSGQTLQITGLNNGTCPTASFASNVTLVYAPANTWRGINTTWSDAQNWCGGVPAGTANVTIPNGVSNYPVISSGTVQTNNITIGSSASVTISGGTMRISGSISNNGTFTVGSGTLELNGTSAQSIAGSQFAAKTIANLKISNSSGVSLTGTNDTLKITGSVDFGASNAVLTTNGNLTLVSNATATARVGDLTAGGTISGANVLGNVTVERYIPNHPKAWQFLAAPTMGSSIKNSWQEGNTALGNTRPGYGTIITGNVNNATSAGFDIQTSTPSLKVYNSSTTLWDGVATTTQSIANGKGYMLFVRGDRSVTTSTAPATAVVLRTTGQLYTIGANAPASVSVASGKMESVANPYASAIDFTAISKTGSVDNKFYIWDPLLTNNSNGLGGFQTLSATNGWKPIPGGTANFNAGTSYTSIQSGQAFFISSTSGGGSIGFTEACKTTGSANQFRLSQRLQERQFLRVSLYNAAGNLADGNVVALDTDLADSIDGDDAIKLMSAMENIAIVRGNVKLALDARPPIAMEDTIHYAISNMRAQNYQLKFEPENMGATGLIAYLQDKFLNYLATISLTDTTTYAFNVNAAQAGSFAADRFQVILRPSGTLPVHITSLNAKRMEPTRVQIACATADEINIDHYELEHSFNGRRFELIQRQLPLNNQGGAVVYQWTHQPVSADAHFYRVVAISSDGGKQYSPIAKVNALAFSTPIVVYPNPVQNKTIQLEVAAGAGGSYTAEVFDAQGRICFREAIRLQSGLNPQAIRLNRETSAGQYTLRLSQSDAPAISLPVQVD